MLRDMRPPGGGERRRDTRGSRAIPASARSTMASSVAFCGGGGEVDGARPRLACEELIGREDSARGRRLGVRKRNGTPRSAARSDEVIERAGVLDDDVGHGDLFGQGHLRARARATSSSRAWSRGRTARDLQRARARTTTTSGRNISGQSVLDDERSLVAGERLAARGQLGCARHVSAPMRGWRIPFRRARAAGSRKTTSANFFRSSSPSAVRTSRRTPRRPPRARGSPSPRPRAPARRRRMTGTPRARKRAATVLFPDAIPPVRPNRCMASVALMLTRISWALRRRLCPSGLAPRRAAVSSRSCGGGLVGGLGGGRLVRMRGYALPDATRAKLESLNAWQYVVVQHVARRIAAPDRDDASIPTTDDTDVVGFVDGYVARMPAAVRRDLLRALAFVEHLAPLGVGLVSRFTRLSAVDQDRVLGVARIELAGPPARRVRRPEVARLHGLLPRPAHLADPRLRRSAREPARRRVVVSADRPWPRPHGRRDAGRATPSSSVRVPGDRSRCASSRAPGSMRSRSKRGGIDAGRLRPARGRA